MELLLASSNPHKVREVRAVLGPLGVEIVGLDSVEEAAGVAEPVEDGETFADNARIKAAHYARATGMWCLADDSGLEADALGGRPGVHSARYAGSGGSRDERDRANNALLLAELDGVADDRRTARFVCAMCLCDPQGRVAAETRGTIEGAIGCEPRGRNGFGYDPLFVLPDLGCTLAQVTADEKNARSHRGQAARRMAEHLKKAPGTFSGAG